MGQAITRTLWIPAALVLFAVLGAWAVAANDSDKAANAGKEPGKPPMQGVRVALVTGEGFQDAEALMPLAYLTNRGAEVVTIGSQRGTVKAYNSDIMLRVQESASDVKPAQFDALVIPGGKAPSKLREKQDVVEFVRGFAEAGKPVAAICHGPQLLVTAGVVEGKSMTCYRDVANELRGSGADYRDRPVVRHGNMVTSRNPNDIPVWLGAMEKMILESIQTPEPAE